MHVNEPSPWGPELRVSWTRDINGKTFWFYAYKWDGERMTVVVKTATSFYKRVEF